MKLSDTNIAFNHNIVDGSEYCWNCYPDARYLDYESGYATASVIFSTTTQEVYEATVCFVDSDERPYRWMNSSYKQANEAEAKVRNVDTAVAWDNVKWIDLETEEDFLEKASAMFKGEPFDPRISVPLDLTDDEFLRIAKLAHEEDVTFNEYVANILQEAIKELKKEV